MSNIVPFDYSAVDEICRDDVRDAAVRIKVRMARTASDIVEIGMDLIAVKSALGHGQFLIWLDTEFGMSERTARNFISVAEKFGTKSATVADLTASVLYALSSPSTPDEVVSEVVERTDGGERFTAADVRELKAEWAQRERDLKAKAESADALKSDYANQVSELQQKLHAERDAKHTLEHELSKARKAAPAPDVSGPYFAWAADMNRVWGRAPQEWRDMWLAQIDTPVFDRTFAAQ